jgi:hypothetical protein
MWDFWTVNLQSVVSHHPEEKISECAVMREVGMGLDQSSPKTALVINNVALFVALVGGYHQLSWIISGNSIPNTAIKGNSDLFG